MKKKFLLQIMCGYIVASMFTGCLQGSGGPLNDPADEEEEWNTTPTTPSTPTPPASTGYAPQSLAVGSAFAASRQPAYGPGTGNKDQDIYVYKVVNGTSGHHMNSFYLNGSRTLLTPYSYQKTGNNTASFSISCEQYINGPVSHRIFYYKGTLTFTSANVCKYEATVTYSHISGSGKQSYTFWYYPQSPW
jgi:hypothetical protein